MGGWVTTRPKVTQPKVTQPQITQPTNVWGTSRPTVTQPTSRVTTPPPISMTGAAPAAPIGTFPIGGALTGFESLTPAQQAANDALLAQLISGLQGAPAFKFPQFTYPEAPTPAAPIAAPTVPSLAPTPIDMPAFEFEGVDPSDVGNIQDMLATLPGISPEVQRTLSTLMKGAGARPEQTLEEILASIPQFGGELGEETKTALERALSGEFPEEYFQESIAGPARTLFEERTAPAIREEFVGPGTYWGGERAGEVTGKRQEMESNLSAIRGELGNQAQERSLQATVTSISARQNQIGMAMEELANQRANANAQQVTALNAASTLLENQQQNLTVAQNELNRLSKGKYEQIALAQERWGEEVGALRQEQELIQRGEIEEAGLGQRAWETSLEAQLRQQEMTQQQYQFGAGQAERMHLANMEVAYNTYIQQNPAMSQYLEAALSYLNIPMMAAYQEYEGGGSVWGTSRG